jgi:hypothetical protein
MIPDAAVEAALAARLAFKNQRGMDNNANLMRHILEAAAPHLMAAAWEEGRLDGHAEEQSGFENAMNPYRTAGAGE